MNRNSIITDILSKYGIVALLVVAVSTIIKDIFHNDSSVYQMRTAREADEGIAPPYDLILKQKVLIKIRKLNIDLEGYVYYSKE